MKSFFHSLSQKRLKQKAQKFLARGKVEKAFQIFQTLVLNDESADTLFNLALCLMGMNRFIEAEKYLSRLQNEFPQNEINTLTLAECLMLQKKWEDAQVLYKNLHLISENKKKYKEYLDIVQDPVAREKYVTAKLLLRKATEKLQAKKDSEALELLLEAEEYISDNSNILNNIGSIYMLQKDYRKAYQYFLKALALDKHSEHIKKNILLARRKLKK